MAKLQYRTISKRTVDALSVEDRDAVFWDDKIPGFGVRVYPSGSKVFVVQTRTQGKSKRITLGRHGVLTADQARKKAAETIALLKSGQEPGRKPAPAVTVAELAARYFEEHVDVRCKPATRKMYRSIVKRFILPAYGHLPVEKVGREHVARLHHALRDRPCMANRVLEIGSKLFNLAEEWELRSGSNPCRFVRKYRESKRERFLTDEEFRRLGQVLSAMEAEGRLPAHPAAALRLLMLTGCRATRSCSLRGRTWTWRRAKSGCLTRKPVRGWCRCLQRRRGCWRSFRASRAVPGSFRAGSRASISPASTTTGTGCVRMRTLKTCASTTSDITFASRALALGESLSMIGKLLGHNKIDTTARYAHLARDSIKASSAKVADSIGADILEDGKRDEAAAPA